MLDTVADLQVIQRSPAALHLNTREGNSASINIKKVKDSHSWLENSDSNFLVWTVQIQRLCVLEPDRFQRPQLGTDKGFLRTKS
jgi:hypothetical protein